MSLSAFFVSAIFAVFFVHVFCTPPAVPANPIDKISLGKCNLLYSHEIEIYSSFMKLDGPLKAGKRVPDLVNF